MVGVKAIITYINNKNQYHYVMHGQQESRILWHRLW